MVEFFGLGVDKEKWVKEQMEKERFVILGLLSELCIVQGYKVENIGEKELEGSLFNKMDEYLDGVKYIDGQTQAKLTKDEKIYIISALMKCAEMLNKEALK